MIEKSNITLQQNIEKKNIQKYNSLAKEHKDTKNIDILNKAYNRAIGGGVAGSSAMIIQITSLMWLRTTMNYQYKYGGNFRESLSKLYNDGGIKRFYRGYSAALAIGPLSRFGDTAANAYILSLFEKSSIPVSIQTLCGSSVAALWRAFLMPIDAVKTTLQVKGKSGLSVLKTKMINHNPLILYHGTIASMSATFVGHYPWFLTYNILNEQIPKYDELHKKLLRSAFIGFNAAVISDCSSNFLRVIKTVKQTSKNNSRYSEIVKNIIKKNGVKDLFGRGLKTRIITNGIQGILFTVCWRFIEESYTK